MLTRTKTSKWMVESIYFLKPAWCGTHPAGLWPEQGLQPVTRATALRRWFLTLIDGPDAASPAANAAPVEAVETPPDSSVVLAQPAPAEAEANTAAVAAKKNNGTINKVWAASIAALLGDGRRLIVG